MSLFKQIFDRNLRKGTAPSMLVEDMGPLKGFVQWHQIDEKTGRILKSSGKQNALVNQSKTNLIRLISQGTSPWAGALSPAQLRISKMRFGNANTFSTPSKFYYYNLGETSTRANIPYNSFAPGGNRDDADGQYPGAATTFFERLNSLGTNGYTLGTGGEKIYTIHSVNRPPSQGTFKIEFLKESVLVETLYFGNASGETFTYPYTRKPDGNPPTKIISESANESSKVCTPSHSVRPDADFVITYSSPETNSRLYYDYANTAWKYVSYENASAEPLYTTIKFTYDIGKHNVINSIIPRNGYNAGVGVTANTRFVNTTFGDFYPISTSSVEYRDCADDFIDDYSATFSVVMSGQYGNGNIIGVEKLTYTEAFLFNELDEMFSAVYLDSSHRFEKNSLTAFYISWTILAPIN